MKPGRALQDGKTEDFTQRFEMISKWAMAGNQIRLHTNYHRMIYIFFDVSNF